MTLWQETGLALSRQSWCDKSARMSLQPPSKIGPDGEKSGLLKPSPPLTRLLNHRGLQLKSLEKSPRFSFWIFSGSESLHFDAVYGLSVLFLQRKW